ncbi:hypothetical protein ABL78_7846 [Leptomonas seymouri]|uniref:Uncharacterized protein n=1 Tax=Leptomonas seymouri TaxID=5684 RepID=A0A0N1PB80_LEPSE|nr:hypothetical protein ABL78_7846 [Leptomonas seymouri]|eukprot:KPI83125.1 hypothetical protein ABL78_7846 [Leptomonas seymouri]
MLRLGRQSKLLRSSLKNDRHWSRNLLEVTSWCIHGLPRGDAVYPVDETSLPFAGVRVRLCGKGGGIRIIPRRLSDNRGVTTLSEVGACAWLQHGDALDFGGSLQLRFLAVRVRKGLASELAQKASFTWVRATAVAESATPAAMWTARFSDWSAIPTFLKAKMLMEAAMLSWQADLQEDAQMQASSTTAAAPPSTASKLTLSRRCCDRTGASNRRRSGQSTASPSLGDAQSPEDGIETHDSGPCSSSEARQDACTAVDDVDEEAATPTSDSQQCQRQRQQRLLAATGSQQLFRDRGQSQSSTGVAPDARAASERSQHASSGWSPPLQCVAASGTQQRPFAPSLHPRGNVGRYSLATFSETMDDKLHEALLNLENGGTGIGDLLIQQQHRDPAVLLGAMDDDFSGSRAASAEEGTPRMLSHSPASGDKHEGQKDLVSRQPPHVSRHPRRSTKRGGSGEKTDNGVEQRRRSGCRKSAGSDVDGDVVAPRKHRRSSSATAWLSQPTRKKGEVDDDVAILPLTRADIKRLRVNQPSQEDSQVVFFDH